MASMEMNKEYVCFVGNFEMFLMSIIYKMQIMSLKNDSKGLILGTNTEKLYSIFEFGAPQTKLHLSCHLYLLSSYCSMYPSYKNMFDHYTYLAVEDRKGTNLFADHVLNDEWNPYYYVKE